MKHLRLLGFLAILALPSLASAKKLNYLDPILEQSDDWQFDDWFALPTMPFIPGIVITPTGSPPTGTSGTLTSQTAQNWSTAPWVITSGAGTYPDGGGVATWGTHTNTVIGTVAANATVTLDVPITLSGLTYNSPFSMTLAGSVTNNLGLTTTGPNIFNAQLTIMNTLSLFQLANSISAPITGGGAFGLTKTGNGTITLSAANTYTGGTHVDAGFLVINGTNGDGTLGASGAGNGITMNGGNLVNNITGGWTTTRDIFLDAGGGSILPVTAATLGGVISGAGNFAITNFASTVTLTAVNTYTGLTLKTVTTGALTLSGDGSINQSSGYDFAGTVNLSNVATNNNDRLSNSAPLNAHQMTLTLAGNAAAATSENVGVMTLANGINNIAVTPNAAQSASLNFAGINRQNHSTLVVRGTNLGAAAGNGVAQITSATSPGTLFGGGGSIGSTNINILPWAVGNVSATTTANSSFVTWNSVDGTFRPLAAGEYSALASGASSMENTNVAVATAISAPTTVNSVRVTGTGTLLTGTGGLNITSGALLYSPANTTAGTISANINFGSSEGVVTSTAGTASSFTPGLTLSGAISGSGGLTLNPIIGSSIAVTGANTYTGTTTLLGFTVFSGTVSNDGVTPSPFGLDTSAIVFNSANGITGLAATAAATVNRNLSIIGGPSAGGAQLLTSGAFTFAVNGNIDLQSALTMQSAAGTFALNGIVSGPGNISDLSTPLIQLNGNNTYSGGTNIQTGTWAAGSDTAFGTGTIYFSNTGRIQSADATAHTVSNDIFVGANPTFQGTGALNFTGGVNLNGARSFTVSNTAAGGTAFSGVVSNGALTKTGTGLMALNSPTGNTYTGGTVLANAAGILNVNNVSGSGTGSGTVSIGGTTVANRSTLSGNFTISGATSISGTLSPGNSVGTANFGSSLTLAVNSNSVIEIASAASFDHINVAGLLTLPNSATAGSFTFSISTTGGYDAPIGTTFDIVDWGTLASGTFNPATQIAFTNQPGSAGTMLDTSNFLINGTVTVIPEPSTWTMIGAGASMLVAMMRLRRRSS